MRVDFEARYRAAADPWQAGTSAYEQHKRERTLAACGDGPFASACDLGSGTGHLSQELAARSEALLALDGAPSAVAATAARLADHPGAEARKADLPGELPVGPFDLVVASEVLYYLSAAELTDVLGWLESALAPEGRLVAVHWTGEAPDLGQDAHAVHAALLAHPALQALAPTHDDPAGYRLDVLERR